MIHQVKIIEGGKIYYDSIKEDKFNGDVFDIIKIEDKHNLGNKRRVKILFKDKKGDWIYHVPYVLQLK